MSRSEVLCILGMHRTGTSLVAGVLHRLGVYLGPPQRLMGAKPDNPRGFWEYEPFTEINDAILEAFDGSWDRPPPLPPGWERDRRLTDLRHRAADMVRSDFRGRRRWAFKDPRTSLTLPFWQRLLPRMRYVVCLRNPVDVAGSLDRRNALPIDRSAELWLRYTASALAHTSGRPRLLVFYEDIMAGRTGELNRLSGFVGAVGRGPPPLGPAVDGFIAEELQHHTTGPDAVVADGRLPLSVRALYLMLRVHLAGDAEGVGPLPEGTVDAVAGTYAGTEVPGRRPRWGRRWAGR